MASDESRALQFISLILVVVFCDGGHIFFSCCYSSFFTFFCFIHQFVQETVGAITQRCEQLTAAAGTIAIEVGAVSSIQEAAIVTTGGDGGICDGGGAMSAVSQPPAVIIRVSSAVSTIEDLLSQEHLFAVTKNAVEQSRIELEVNQGSGDEEAEDIRKCK